MTETAHADGPIRAKTVLVVEDDYGCRDSTRKWLLNFGFNVVEAASGDEALSLVQGTKETIEVAIVDMGMSEMWGDEFALRLAIISPETKVIFVSGHSEDFLRMNGSLTGNEIFFAKPFSSKLLLEKIREMLGIEVPAVPAPDSGSSHAVENQPSQILHFAEYDDLHIETDRRVE